MFFSKLFRRSDKQANVRLEDLTIWGKETLAGVTVTTATAMRISAVYACIRILAESVAQIPLHVYRRRADGRGKDRASDHPLHALLHDSGSPNEWQTAYEFKELLQAHTALRGNGYAYISRNPAGRVLELLPLNCNNVTVKQDGDMRVSYSYVNANGKTVNFKREEIFHVRGLGSDGIVGLNPIQLHMEALGLAKAGETHGAKFFGNFAQPSGILQTKQLLDDDKMKKTREAWEASTAGKKAFRTAILDGDWSWTKMTMTNEEAQFLETRKFQAEEIARLWRVPPHMIALLDRATNNNIEQMSLEFVMYTMMPWLKRWEGVVNKQLFTEREKQQGYFAEFLVDALLRGDFKTRVDGYGQMINWGMMSPNEGREKENMNPREGGDVYLTPVNMTTKPNDSNTKTEKEPK